MISKWNKYVKQTIWRGEGGGGDATTDSEINFITSLTNSIVADTALTTANAAASAASALAAATSESNAAASEIAAASSASAASASAISADASANSAANSYDSFDDRYLGSKTVAPTLDNDGNALLVGALYWNSVTTKLFVWSGTAWRDGFFSGLTSSLVTATAGQTVVTTPTYVVGTNTIQVYVNGLKVILGTDFTETSTTSITFSSGLTLGDEVEIVVVQSLTIGTAAASNVSYTPTGTIAAANVQNALSELSSEKVQSTVLSASGGSSLVGYLPSGTGAVASTVQSKLREFVSIKDFGADPAASAAANTTAIAAALTYAGTKKCGVYVPGEATAYQVNDEFTVPNGVMVFGDGWGSFIQQVTLNKDVFIAGGCNTFQNLRLKIADGNNTDFVNCIYASGVNNLTVENCFLESSNLGGCGIHIRNVQNSQIRGNRIYNGQWNVPVAGPSSSASDILLYSSGASERHIIEGNHCLSNNSQGIFVDALGYDGDIIIANNICVTLDPATCTEGGAWSLAATGGVRRHGIVVGYNTTSVSGIRAVVDGNICRNTRWTGIYKQGVSTGAVIISNNLCDLNGYEISATLAGGIFLTQAGGELVANNTITNYQNTVSGDTGAITVTSAAPVTVPSEIRGNKILGSAGYGIVLKLQSAFVTVDGNSISGCANSDIFAQPSSGIAAVIGHRITNNVITKTTATLKPGIRINIQSSTLYTLIKNNVINGDDNTTNDVNNSGIYRSGADAYIQIIGNKISNFYFGVYGANYWTGGRMSDVQFESNVIHGCNTGFALGATSGVQTVPLVDNRFINVTTQSAAALGGAVAGRIVTRQGDDFVGQTAASPTLGTWAVGDRSANSTPAVGQPKGWLCTVAGAPGTWVSEGNL